MYFFLPIPMVCYNFLRTKLFLQKLKKCKNLKLLSFLFVMIFQLSNNSSNNLKWSWFFFKYLNMSKNFKKSRYNAKKAWFWRKNFLNIIWIFLKQNSKFHPSIMMALWYPGLHLNRKYYRSMYELCSMLM